MKTKTRKYLSRKALILKIKSLEIRPAIKLSSVERTAALQEAAKLFKLGKIDFAIRTYRQDGYFMAIPRPVKRSK